MTKPVIKLEALRDPSGKGCSIDLYLGGKPVEFSAIFAEAVISIGQSMCEGETDNKLVHIQVGVMFLKNVFDDIRVISKKVIDEMGMEEALMAAIEAMAFRHNGQASCPDEQCESCKLNPICHPGEKTTSTETETESIQTTQENKNVQ